MTPRPASQASPGGTARDGVRAYLLCGVFLTGAAVLALELVGSRVISPFYGSSLPCWAAVITVTMVALALGYALGGRAADRDPSPALFPKAVAAAGLALALVPALRSPVLLRTAGLGVRLGAMASAAILLGPALTLLGSLGPIVVRLTTRDVASVGKRAGEAMAVSTLGSVLGAVAAAFLMIPHFSLTTILYGMSAALFALAAAGVLALRLGAPAKTAAAAAAAAALAFWPGHAAGTNIVLDRLSAYGSIRVLDFGGRRYLFVDGTTQSLAELKADGKGAAGGAGPRWESASPYLESMELAALLRPRAARALFIGSGAGLLPMRFERVHGIVSDVVEIDPAMIETARSCFGFAPRGSVFFADGRAFLEGAVSGDAAGRGAAASAGRYGVVVLDAFVGENPPYHLLTAESFRAAKRALEHGGVLTANLVSLVDREPAPWPAVLKTLRSVFRDARAFAASEPHRGLANVVFLASDEPLGPALADPALLARAGPEARRALLRLELEPSARALAAAPSLTDDFAPVESLLAETALAWREVIQDTAGQVILH